MCIHTRNRRRVSLALQSVSIPALLFPVSVFAEQMQPIRIFPPDRGSLTFTSLANSFGDLANAVIPFLIGIGILVVLWGAFQYLTAAGDAEKIAEGRKAALYGVLALFFMVAFWGIVVAVKGSLFGS